MKKSDVSRTIINWCFVIFIIGAVVTMIFALGSSIVKDYQTNGMISVILSFVIGIPLSIGMMFLFTKSAIVLSGRDQKIYKLYKLLDDIDTLDDIAGSNDAIFRKRTYDLQRRRFEIISEPESDSLYRRFYKESPNTLESKSDSDKQSKGIILSKIKKFFTKFKRRKKK